MSGATTSEHDENCWIACPHPEPPSGAFASESLFTARELEAITAALLHFGAFCGSSPPSDVTSHADGWQCEAILRRINPYAADELASKLVPRIDTGYSHG